MDSTHTGPLRYTEDMGLGSPPPNCPHLILARASHLFIKEPGLERRNDAAQFATNNSRELHLTAWAAVSSSDTTRKYAFLATEGC